jgi:tetratricopeptide (TPR) repeat protein
MTTDCLVALSRDLERLVRDVLAIARIRPARIGIERASRAFTLTPGRSSGGSELVAAAERELLRLHRVELAFHLRQAARAVLAGAAETRSLAQRRAGLRDALAVAASDGMRASPALFALLERCLRAGGDAPRASELARAALELHDVEAGRALSAEALLAAGELDEAQGAFARALARRPSAGVLHELVAGWTAAARLAGDVERVRDLERAARASEVAA